MGRRYRFGFLLPFISACSAVTPPVGCPSDEPPPKFVAVAHLDEEWCLQFSVDAILEPETPKSPPVIPGASFDPSAKYRLTALSVSVPWVDGPAASTPESGWIGWRAFFGHIARYGAICRSAEMYQAVCAPARTPASCHAADGEPFHPGGAGNVICFANDWAGHYGNNSGCATVRMCKLSR